MAEIVSGVLRAAIEVGKWVSAPIKRQFNYLCCFTTNINGLKDEAKKLDAAARGLQGRVDRATDNLEVVVPEVGTWLENSGDMIVQTTKILDQVPNVENGCLKFGARCSLSKRAKKTTDQMKKLGGECKFDAIAQPGPPAARGALLLGKTYEFESRKHIEEDIMTTLRGGDVSMIGISGMGGLGKTTMAKTIMNRALEEHIFEEVVMAVVSQQVDKSKIQDEIAESLGLTLQTSKAAGAQKLHARLSGTKRILLVLDDVWQRLILEDLGIPCDSKGCTILLTSRNRDALSKMNVQKTFEMEILSGKEAWFLFREGAGTCVDDNKLNSKAKEVVKECRGLPIALTTVGLALKDKSDVRIWDDALRQLKKSDLDIPDFIREVYNPLKLSYDFLESKHAKSIFLLCCLFPEDANIPLEKLTYLCMGLRIFGNLEEARNRMCALTEMLKSRSLLLDGEDCNVIGDEDCVRMHDVVRDVCIFIAKQEKYIGGNDCTWISTCQLPTTGLGFPNLRLLFLSGNFSAKEEFKLDSVFLEGIRDLNVLCIGNYNSLTLLPQTSHSLKNLNTLLLYTCQKLNSISFVGELVNLEILICDNCGSIEELPPDIKRLNRLKLLQLTFCLKLQRIGRGIISSLVGLEELKMLGSFRKWEAEDREERENAGLRELEILTKLRCLEIEIDDPALATEKMHLSLNIERFYIRFGTPNSTCPAKKMFNKEMVLALKRETSCLADWIEMQLLRDTQCLELFGNGANTVDLAKSQNIRWLELGRCETMKNITVLPSIEHLGLSSLPQLQEIWDAPISSTSFHNLKELQLRNLAALKQLWKSSSQTKYVPRLFTNLSSIDISDCPLIRNLGQLSIAAGNDCLSQLEFLYIKRCETMEQVFLWNEEDENKNNSESRNHHVITKVFPKLKELNLISLPSLATFYHGIEGIEFPLLMNLSIIECPKMIFVRSNGNSRGSSKSADIDDDDSAHLFCQPKKVSFGNLKKLEFDGNPFCCHKIPLSLFNGLEVLTFSELHGSMSLFSSSIAENLVNLRELSASKCGEMLKVIEDKEEEKKGGSGTGERDILFPKLQKLELEDLPKLVSFCEWKCDGELPSLKEVVIKRCPDMENFSLGVVAAPRLHYFTTDFKNNLEIGFKVLFNSLKKVVIRGNENPFYGHKLSISLFNALKELEVYEYHGSMSLFTCSVTRNLVSLEVLAIVECNEMVKVIEDEEEEEKVVSGGQRTLLFPKLHQLVLLDLPKLVSFCECKHHVELPSLGRLVILGCPEMKKFTMGSIAAPYLGSVNIDHEDIGGTKDLNGLLHRAYFNSLQDIHQTTTDFATD